MAGSAPPSDHRTPPSIAKLHSAWRSVPVKHYVEATDWPDESPMAAMTARARGNEQFTVHSWDTTHNVMHDGPERVLSLIADL